MNIRFFIDRNPKYFGAVLDFLREGRVRNSEVSDAHIEEVREEFEHFSVPIPTNLVSNNYFRP